MTNLYIYLISLILFVVSLFVGTIMYKRDYSKKFNFLNHYPFELKTNFNISLLNAFRAGLIGSIIILFIAIYLTFYHSVDGSFSCRFASFSLIIEGIIVVSLFVVPLYYYKSHLLLIISLMIFNFVNSFILGFSALVQVGMYNIFYFGIFYFFLGFISFILLCLPILKSWYKDYLDEENKDRKKIISLSLIEWSNIIIYFLIILIGIIRYIVY